MIIGPYRDESYRIHEGLRIARQLLVDINRLGVPAGGGFLDVISPQYIGDLIAWGDTVGLVDGLAQAVKARRRAR